MGGRPAASADRGAGFGRRRATSRNRRKVWDTGAVLAVQPPGRPTRPDGLAYSTGDRIAGVVVIAVVGVMLGATRWLGSGSLDLLAEAPPFTYLLVTASKGALVRDIVTSLLVLIAGHALLSYRLRQRAPGFGFGEIRYLLPLVLASSALVVTTLVLAFPGMSWWAPLVFVGVDLHVLVVILAVAFCAQRFDQSVGDQVSAAIRRRVEGWWNQWPAVDPSFRVEVFVAVVSLIVVVLSSPLVRFTERTRGDEPKYLRYAENWWQGHGMEMSNVLEVSALPRDARPQVGRNLAMLGPALRDDVRAMVKDAIYLGNYKHWRHKFNKAHYAGNWVVQGKDGGLYLMHGPGLSMVILPAYLIDRWLFDRGRLMFSDDLFTTNLTMLVIYVLLGAACVRMLTAAGVSMGNAALVTLACVLSLPVPAFAFQFYPETLAALIVCLFMPTILDPSPSSSRAALLVGLGLGSLGWLHVRFLGVGAVCLAWYVWVHRRESRRLAVTFAGFGVVMAALCLYTYHVTGSLVVTAIFTAEGGHGTFAAHWVPRGLIGYLFDRESGLLPLAPMYLLAPLGIGLMTRRPLPLLMVGSIMLALLIPAAGHGFENNGASPLRLVLAVVPLATVPVAEFFAWARGRRFALIVGLGVLALSVRQAIAYNLGNDKEILSTVARSVSGWDPTLMFPLLRRAEGWGTFDGGALVAWEAAVVLLIVSGVLMRNSAGIVSRHQDWVPPHAIGAVVLGLLSLGTAAILAGGPAYETRLLKEPLAEWQGAPDTPRLPGGWLTFGPSPARSPDD